MSKGRTNVVVFGASKCKPGEKAYRVATELGAAVARRGWTLVNGGYGGAMLASAQGAAGAEGHVIGVTCSFFRGKPNPHLAEQVVCDDMHARLKSLIELGDAYIVMPGSTGTLAELALVWELVNKGLIPARPILCWGDFWRPVIEIFANESTKDPRLDTKGVPDKRGQLIAFINTPDEAIVTLREHFESR